MKAKALLTAVLLAAANSVWANGGLTIDNVEQHMDAQNWIATDAANQEIIAQGSVDKFDVASNDGDRTVVDTNQLRQSYDGQS